MQYIIFNEVDKQHFVIYFTNSVNCRNWIINTLDLSKKWSFEPYNDNKIEGLENYNYNITEGSK